MTDPNEKELVQGLMESGYSDDEICSALGLTEEEYKNIMDNN
ncbi:hypothetical protein [Scopulibacillus cellulosilyticus]|uniref:Uncharacterized protein n=1 Tax=Scopulibacillus cellulosilyticus TaxID=2665665 RepID=A0ABW2PVE8_9BACL